MRAAITHGAKRALSNEPAKKNSPVAEDPQAEIDAHLLESLYSLDGNHVCGTGLVQRKTGGYSDKIAAFDEAELD